MSSKFRNTHLLHLLDSFEKQPLPLDVFLRIYFKKNTAIGSHDRKYLSETLYGLIRWLGLVDHFCQTPSPSWEERVQQLQTLQPEFHLQDTSIPLHHRVSFPQDYWDLLVESLGEEQAKLFCLESNYPAPTTIRVNELKTSRKELLLQWQGTFPCKEGLFSPSALHFPHRVNFFGLPQFKEGLFEVQDEASQLVAYQVAAKPGDQVLDYCAGSGGKSLAFAPKMQGKGQIYLHDIRSQALLEAKKRLKRAGIQNAQLLESGSPKKKHLIGKMDWVLVDAPCSGSGTLRRNPDMKWKFHRPGLQDILSLQRSIMEEALLYVKPKGKIVYATCSILPLENDLQIQHFLQTLPLQQLSPPFRSFPTRGGMDGFYAATLQKL